MIEMQSEADAAVAARRAGRRLPLRRACAALELNPYVAPTDPDLSGAELEERYVTLVQDVRAQL